MAEDKQPFQKTLSAHSRKPKEETAPPPTPRELGKQLRTLLRTRITAGMQTHEVQDAIAEVMAIVEQLVPLPEPDDEPDAG